MFDKLPSFLGAKNLQPFIGKDLRCSTNSIEYKPLKGGGLKGNALGYIADLLPGVCKVYWIMYLKEGIFEGELCLLTNEEGTYKCRYLGKDLDSVSWFKNISLNIDFEVDETEWDSIKIQKIETIELSLDGDSWCALLGENLQTGIAGFGKTKAEALHRLAEEIY